MPSSLPSYRSSIGGWTLERYQQLLSWPILVAGVLCFLVAMASDSTGVLAGAQILVMIFYGVRLARRRVMLMPVAVTGALVGLVLGVASGVGEWFSGQSLLWGFTIVTQTAVTMVAASALTLATVIIIRKRI